MIYKILGNKSNYILFNLSEGELIKAQPGAMIFMEPTVKMETKSSGIFNSLKRKLVGESTHLNYFKGPGKIAFAGSFGGSIFKVDVDTNNGLITNKGCFLIGTENIEIDVISGGIESLLGGKGLFLQKIIGNGTSFLTCYGDIIEIDLNNDELIVDNGNLVAFSESLSWEIVKIFSGIRSFIFGGEGIGYKLKGSGKVYISTNDIYTFANNIISLNTNSH